jgi:hypothetical protein
MAKQEIEVTTARTGEVDEWCGAARLGCGFHLLVD